MSSSSDDEEYSSLAEEVIVVDLSDDVMKYALQEHIISTSCESHGGSCTTQIGLPNFLIADTKEVLQAVSHNSL